MLTIKEVIKTLYNAFNQKLKNHRGNWEQNDPTAEDYIKNRPFYTENGSAIVVLPETNVIDRALLNESLIIGQSYIVTCNGIDYTCICKEYDGYRMLGNNAIYEYDNGIITDTGEPFALEASGDSKEIYFYFNESASNYMIKIVITQDKIKKIDKKYLPDLAPVATSGSYNDLSNKPTIYTDAVRYASQNPTRAQRTEARSNIMAVGYDAQTLTDAQKTQARTNIGAGTSSFSGNYNDLKNKPTIPTVPSDIIRYDIAQSLTADQQEQVRNTIGITQSDWDEMSPEAQGYIKNRICYENITTIDSGLLYFRGSNGSGTIVGAGITYYFGQGYIAPNITDFNQIYINEFEQYIKAETWVGTDETGFSICVIGNPRVLLELTNASNNIYNMLLSNFSCSSISYNNNINIDTGEKSCFVYICNPYLSSYPSEELYQRKYPCMYFSLDTENPYTSLTFLNQNIELKQLDEKFIPDAIARTSDVIPVPATASAGQTIVVKSVDDTGKPTEWEASDVIKKLTFLITSYPEYGILMSEKTFKEVDDFAFKYGLEDIQANLSISGQTMNSETEQYNPCFPSYSCRRVREINQSKVIAYDFTFLVNNEKRLYRLTENGVALLESSVIPSATTASIGQTLVVKTIDDAGKPTEWEATRFLKSINDTEPDENGNFALIENKTWQAIEMASIPGMLNAYGIDAAEVSYYLRNNVHYHSVFYRIIMKTDGSVETRPHTHVVTLSQDDGTNDVVIYHGDDLAPIIVDVSENTFTLDPNWVAPIESIPTPAVASVGQIIAVKTVDENGKPTEWETIDPWVITSPNGTQFKLTIDNEGILSATELA